MKRSQYHINLYILVPTIFTAISLLCVIGAYRISLILAQSPTKAVWPLWVWGAGIGTFTFLCGLMIAWLILRPVKKFIREAEGLSILPKSADISATSRAGDDIQHFTEVFERVTELLTKVESKELFPNIIGQSEVMRGLFPPYSESGAHRFDRSHHR